MTQKWVPKNDPFMQCVKSEKPLFSLLEYVYASIK